MSCSLGSRCIQSRSGKAVCVKDREKFYPSRSQQQKRDQKRNSGDNILNEACREGDLSRGKHILTEGHVDINSRERENGRTPVMLAARAGHRALFHCLIKQGCNVSLVDNNGDNILHMACYGGHLEIVKNILSLDIVDINIRGQFGMTSVMVAALKGHRDVFDVVMRKGGNASLVDGNGDNILHLACLGGNVEIVKYILTQNITDIICRGFNGRTPLMFAATWGHRDVFDLLVSKGGDVSAVDDNGSTILHMACFCDHVEIVKQILSQDIVDIHDKDQVGDTAAMIAKRRKHVKVYDLIISQG